jgi:hypothetical protein
MLICGPERPEAYSTVQWPATLYRTGPASSFITTSQPFTVVVKMLWTLVASTAFRQQQALCILKLHAFIIEDYICLFNSCLLNILVYRY